MLIKDIKNASAKMKLSINRHFSQWAKVSNRTPETSIQMLTLIRKRNRPQMVAQPKNWTIRANRKIQKRRRLFEKS